MKIKLDSCIKLHQLIIIIFYSGPRPYSHSVHLVALFNWMQLHLIKHSCISPDILVLFCASDTWYNLCHVHLLVDLG